jgi:hypothetical protein
LSIVVYYISYKYFSMFDVVGSSSHWTFFFFLTKVDPMIAISYHDSIMKYLCDISVRDINVALLLWCATFFIKIQTT